VILSGETKKADVKTTTRKSKVDARKRLKPAIPTTVRYTKVTIYKRRITLSGSYDIGPEDTKRKQLSKQL